MVKNEKKANVCNGLKCLGLSTRIEQNGRQGCRLVCERKRDTAKEAVEDGIIQVMDRVGRDSSVGMATRYGLDGPGIESRWGEVFRTSPDRPSGLPSLL